MAQIDIGKLTFTHKGDYASGTAYVLNDVVYYNGSAYIAKTSTTGNLPTSTAHWNNFAAGSGGIWNAGLSLGSANQVVKVNSGASALEFGTVSSDFVKLGTATASSSSTLAVNGFYDDTTYSSYKVVFDNIKFSANTYVAFRVQNATGILTSTIYVGSTTAMSFPYYDNSGWYFDYTQNRYMTNYGNSGGGMNRFEVGLNNNSSDTKARYYHNTNANMTGELMTNVTQATDRRKNWIGEVTFTNNYQNYIAHGMYRINMQVHDLTAHTGFVLVPMSGNIASGSLHLYGLKK